MASQAPPNLGRKKSIAAMSPEEVKEAAAAAAAAALLPPPLDTTPFETMVTTRTEPLEYARVLEIYDRKVDALNQYQEALVHYSAQAQPGQPPPLPPHFRYYLGSCLRAAGDEMTALEFFSQQISIYQNDMQHLVSSEDPVRLAEPPIWFNTTLAPWARLAAAYPSEELTPPAFSFHSAKVHLMLCLHERALIFRGLHLDAAAIEDEENMAALFAESDRAKQDAHLLMARVCMAHGKFVLAIDLIERAKKVDIHRPVCYTLHALCERVRGNHVAAEKLCDLATKAAASLANTEEAEGEPEAAADESGTNSTSDTKSVPPPSNAAPKAPNAVYEPTFSEPAEIELVIVQSMAPLRPGFATGNPDWCRTQLARLTTALRSVVTTAAQKLAADNPDDEIDVRRAAEDFSLVGNISTAELLFRRGNLLLLTGTLPLALRDFNSLIKFETHSEFVLPLFSADAMRLSWQRIKASLPPPAPRSVLALLSTSSHHSSNEPNVDVGSGGGEGDAVPGFSAAAGVKLSATAQSLAAHAAATNAAAASLGLTTGVGASSVFTSDEAVIPRDAHNPALDLAFSLAVFEPLAFSAEGFAFMEAYYTELLIQHGPSARVYWYRANIYKLQHSLDQYVADLERMNLCDDKFLRKYLSTYDVRYDYVDENTCTWIQWTLVLQVYRTRQLLAQHTAHRTSRRTGLAAMKNSSQAAIALARFGQEKKLAPDVVAVLQLLRQFYTLVLYHNNVSLNEKALLYTRRGEAWRMQGDMMRANSDYNKARSIEVHNITACTGLALCALQSLQLEKAAEYCAAGFRAIRMTLIKTPATAEQIMSASKAIQLDALALQTWETVCPFIFLQRPLVTGTKESYSLKHAFNEFSAAEKLAAETAAMQEPAVNMSRSERMQLSMNVRLISILVSTQALLFQHQGEPYTAEALLKVALEVDRSCVMSRMQFMFWELRFGAPVEALKHMRVLAKVLPHADVCTSPTLSWVYRLPTWLHEKPRFWRGSYYAFTGRVTNKASGDRKLAVAASFAAIAAAAATNPLLAQLQSYFDRTFDALADCDLRNAVQSLENACRVDIPLPIVGGLRRFYKHRMPTFDPSKELATGMAIDENRLGLVDAAAGAVAVAAAEQAKAASMAAESAEKGVMAGINIAGKEDEDENITPVSIERLSDKYSRHSWELLARGKKFEEVFACETYGFIDYTVALRVARYGEIFWRRGLMLRRKGNLHRALEDVGVAIDFLQQRVAEQAQAAADLAAANQQTAVPISTILARKLEMYIVVRGAIHYALGQYEVAIDDFTRVLNTDPEHAEAYQQRSLALTQLRKFEMALTDLDVYCSMRTEDLGSLLRLANLFSHLKHYGEAMQLFSRVLQMAPGSPQILYGIGVAHFRRREWSQAEAHFTLFLKKSRVSFPTAQLRLAEVYERQGRYQDALSLLLSLKEQKYNLRRLNQCLGRVHMCLLDYRHAQESFMVALQQDDKDSISLFLHSIVCFELGDLDQTITSLNRLFEIEPKHVEGNFLRGWIYMHDSQYQPAFEHFDRAVNAQRTHVLAVQCRAFCCVFLNQLDKALKDCNRLLAVSQSPAFIASFALVSTTLTPLQSAARSTAATLVLRAFIQTLTKKYDAALLDLNRALEDDRDSPLLHLYRAECWRHKGFPTEAIESYQRCIEELNAMLQRTAIATSTIALALNSSQEGVNIASSASIAAAKQKSRMAILAAQEMNKRHGSQLDSISEQSVKSESEREANARMEREKIEIAAAEDAAANEAEQASRDRLKTIDRVQKNRLRMEGRFNLNRADLASIHNMLGTLLFESQAVADSLSHFDLAIVHSQPNSLAAAHCNKGTIFLEMKRYEDALDQLSIAISRDMGSPDILNNYGVALDHSGQVPKSLEILKSATDSAPNHPLLPLNLGNVLAKLHRHEDAILAYDSHYRAVPPHEPWYVARVANNRGVCHAQQHRPTYALRDLDHALRLFPDLQHATFNRAHVHLTLTDVWSALNDIRTEIRVNNSVYLRNLFEFCKRWEVGLSVACREMSIGFSALPVIRDIAVHDIADEEYRRTRQAIQEAIEMRAPFAVSNDALCVPTCLPDSPQPEPHSFDPFELLDNQSLSSKRLAALLRPSPKIRLLTDQELSSDTVNIAVLTPFQQSLSNALALWKSARSKSVSVPLNIDAAADAVVQFAPVQSDQPELISRSTMSDAQISSEKQMLELLLQAVYSIPTGRQNFRMSLLGRRHPSRIAYLDEFAEIRECVLLWRARVLVDRGDADAALHDLRSILLHTPAEKFVPADQVLWNHLGCLEFQLNKPLEARATFSRASTVDCAAPFPLLNAALVDLHLKRFSHALKNFRMLTDALGFHTGKRGHPGVVGFSTFDATLASITAAPSSASAAPAPAAATAPTSSSSPSKPEGASAASSPVVDDTEDIDVKADTLRTPAVMFGTVPLPADRVEKRWQLSELQSTIYDALRSYGTIMSVRPVNGWPTIVKAQGSLAKALAAHQCEMAAAERQRLFGELIAATEAVHKQATSAIEEHIAALKRSDANTVSGKEDGLAPVFESLVKDLSIRPAYRDMSTRSIMAEENLRIRQEEQQAQQRQ